MIKCRKVGNLRLQPPHSCFEILGIRALLPCGSGFDPPDAPVDFAWRTDGIDKPDDVRAIGNVMHPRTHVRAEVRAARLSIWPTPR